MRTAIKLRLIQYLTLITMSTLAPNMVLPVISQDADEKWSKSVAVKIMAHYQGPALSRLRKTTTLSEFVVAADGKVRYVFHPTSLRPGKIVAEKAEPEDLVEIRKEIDNAIKASSPLQPSLSAGSKMMSAAVKVNAHHLVETNRCEKMLHQIIKASTKFQNAGAPVSKNEPVGVVVVYCPADALSTSGQLSVHSFMYDREPDFVKIVNKTNGDIR